MKKKISVLLALLIIISLGGCSLDSFIGTKTITCDDLTAQVPGLYMDLMGGVDNDAVEFLYGNNAGAVMGVQESVAEVIGASFAEVTAKDYLRMFMNANEVLGTIKEEGNIVYFTYTASVDGESFTYICAAFKGSENFWAVQAYCKTADFEKNQATLWEIIKSVKVS